MIFKKITIENFKSIGPNPVTVNLDFHNTTLLTGQNGAGKTSISEAIVWCIYGVTKLKADNVVNKTVGENTKVELEFSENNKNYVITRYRKHKTHKNNVYVFEEGKNISLKNQVDTQDLIQKIIGIDSRAFMSSIVLSSETYKQFLRETNSVRLQIFESVFSLRELNDFKKYTSQKIKNLEASLSDKNKELISYNSCNEADTNTLKAYKANYQSQIEKLDAQIKLYEMNLAKCEQELESDSKIDFDAEIKKAIEYQLQVSEFEKEKKELEGLKAQLHSYNEEVEYFDSRIKKYTEVLENHSIEELKLEAKRNSEYEQLLEQQKKLDGEITEKKHEIKTEQNNLTTLNLRIQEKKKEREKIKRQLDEVDTHVCPVCGNHLNDSKTQEIRDEYAYKFAELDLQVKEFGLDKKKSQEKIDILEEQVSDLGVKLASLEIVKPNLSPNEIRSIAEQMKEASSQLEPLKLKKQNKQKQIVELWGKIDIYSLGAPPAYDGYSLDWLNENKGNILRLSSEIETLKSQIKLTNQMKETAFDKVYVQKLMDSIKERKAIIGKLNSESLGIRKEIAQYKVLDDVFSNGENSFKKYFINKTIDMFNEKINTFLPFFFDDEIEIKFDKNLNDSIIFRGKETDFEELSSGEKTRAELCVIFSLYFMVQSLFGCGTNLLVVDELLDRGLDAKGIKASKNILDDISKESSVFVVTHRDDLKEMFTSILTVYKDGDGFTRTR
jgi:DNA repair exonuclease SbcCD ATPase subunit